MNAKSYAKHREEINKCYCPECVRARPERKKEAERRAKEMKAAGKSLRGSELL